MEYRLLNHLIRQSQEFADSLEGVFSNLFADEKGVGGIMVFGLTASSSEEQHRRGVLAAAQLASSLNSLDIHDGSVGVMCGQTYAGPVGSDTRSDFTLLGDTVNTAARLMAATKKLSTEGLSSSVDMQLLKFLDQEVSFG